MTRITSVWRSLLICLAVVTFAAAGPVTAGIANVSAQVSIDCTTVPTASNPAASPETAGRAATAVIEPAAFPAEGGDLVVFAAASLTEAFTQISEDIASRYPDVSIEFNFAGSQALVTQLTEGARADVFASANLSQMDAAVEAELIDGEPSLFARNRLVIIVPVDNPAGLESAADLGKDGVLFDIAQEEVPVGQYSRQSVCLMAQDTETYGDEFAARVAANIVSQEDNVRAVVTKVALGEADAGIVYSTDVTPDAADQVLVIPIPDAVNVVAAYPIAQVAGGEAALAGAFIDYVLGPEGQATLEEFGFLPRP